LPLSIAEAVIVALINCGECNKEVSDKAASCPNCGAPIQGAAAKQSLWDSIGQSSGPKEVVIRGTDPAYEGRKLGEGLTKMLLALFLHPAFSYVGFWLICFGLLLSMAPALGLSGKSLKNLPNWYVFSAIGLPVVLAVLLRKFIPKLMKWIFFILVGGLALAFLGGIVSAIIERTTSS
jgi:hypothetical protein